jgi:hypothetical protein
MGPSPTDDDPKFGLNQPTSQKHYGLRRPGVNSVSGTPATRTPKLGPYNLNSTFDVGEFSLGGSRPVHVSQGQTLQIPGRTPVPSSATQKTHHPLSTA